MTKLSRAAKNSKLPLKPVHGFLCESVLRRHQSPKYQPADVYPRATEHIPEMVALIKTLMEKGFALPRRRWLNLLLQSCKFPDYGKLSKIKIGELKAGARVSQDEYTKEEAQDFALVEDLDA